MAASLLYENGDRFKAGAVVYLRLRFLGVAEDFDGKRRAVCEPIGKDGLPEQSSTVQAYTVDESILIPGKTVAEEVRP